MQGSVDRSVAVTGTLPLFAGMRGPRLARQSRQRLADLGVAFVAAVVLATNIDMLATCIGLAVMVLVGLDARVRDRSRGRAGGIATAVGGLHVPDAASIWKRTCRFAMIEVIGIAVALAATACAGGSVDSERTSRSIPLMSSLEGAGGQAEVTATFGTLRYDIELVGLPQGNYGAVVMEGSCEAPGALLEELGPLFAGADGSAGGSGPITTSLEALASWHIAVRDTSGAVVACGS